MIDELRQYTFTAEAWGRYWDFFTGLCLPIRGDEFGVLQGLWHEQVGDTVTFRHIWRYDSLDARAHLRSELIKVDAWREEFLPQAGPLVSEQFLQVLNPKLQDTAQGLSAARYLHTYRCPTGQAANVIQQISSLTGAARTRLCGLWGTEFANPNQVVVMTSTEQAPVLALNTAVAIETRRLQPLGHEQAGSVFHG